jgi:type I restriction enzyme S subunit
MRLRSQNIRINRIDLKDVAFISDQTDAEMKRSVVQHQDVLLNITGASIGRVAQFDLKGVRANVNQHVCIIRPLLEKVDSRYLTYFLSSPQVQHDINHRHQHGGTRQALTFAQIAEFEIPLPPLSDQKRIADILDKADAIRRKRQEAIDQTGCLMRSLFVSLFGNPVQNEGNWPLVSVSDGGEVQLGRQRAPKYQTGRFTRPYMRVANVFEDRIDLSDVLSMDFDDTDFTTFRLQHGDILLNEGQSTELVGRPAMWRNEIPDCCFQNTLVRFRPKPEVTQPEYALQVFLFYLHLGQFARISSKTSSVAHLGAGRFAAMAFPLPPYTLQQRYAQQRRQAYAIGQNIRKHLVESNNLFSSLVQRAFRGEL